MPAGLDRHMGATIDDHLLAGTEVHMLAGAESLIGDTNMTVALHPQMIILFEFGQAIAVGQVMSIAVQLMAGNAADHHRQLVVDLDALVVEHMLDIVALGANGDFFGAFLSSIRSSL
jgi:hypothetical protein